MNTPAKPRSPTSPSRDLARRKTELTTTAQYLVFEPGLYAIEFQARNSGTTDVGLRLPSVRLEPVPPTPGAGRAFVSMSSEAGWLSANSDTAFVLVTGGRAGAVMTIYRASDGMPAPEIRIKAVLQGNDLRPRPTPPPVAVPPPAADPDRTPGAVPVQILAHVTGVGDVAGKGELWAGLPTGRQPIEGFAVTDVPGVALADIECQGILGQEWSTPWHQGGEFCGSRGLALPLLGFRLRLIGAAATGFTCSYWGMFAGKLVGPIAAGEACESDGAALTALRVEILPPTKTHRGRKRRAPNG